MSAIPENAALNPYKGDWGLRWKDTSNPEFQGYLGIAIWMGVHPEIERRQFWNTLKEKGSVYPMIRQTLGRRRWEQIDHFFYPSKPHKRPTYDPTLPYEPHSTPFEKLEHITDHLRTLWKFYWEAGTHLSIDESMVKFTGRSAEIMNIPSKPTSKGFKLWLLANTGYILYFMYHVKGDKKGP